MRTPLSLLILTACDPEQDYKVEPVDSTPFTAEPPDLDGDGYSASAGDCDDEDASVHPGLEDGCDGRDEDCDYQIDEDASWTTWYTDQDGDGHGDAARTEQACAQPDGSVAESGDCNDHNTAVNPDADEQCNGMDDDCDGEADEAGATGEQDWYADWDADGFGDPGDAIPSCAPPDDYLADASDCDDADAEVNPSALERCDGVDNDCNGETDEDAAVDAAEWYADGDGDGFGDADSADWACEAPTGYVSDTTDCDDSSADVNPSATEVCNETDDDCDGTTDEDDAADAGMWYFDADGDGYGDPLVTAMACAVPSGHVGSADDCDDTDASTDVYDRIESSRVIVGFTDGTVAPETLEADGWMFYRVLAFDEISSGVYAIPDEIGPCGAIRYLEDEASLLVEFAEPDVLDEADTYTPNDPFYSTSTSLYSAQNQWNLKALGMSGAWECSKGDGILAAILDTGVLTTAADGFTTLHPGMDCVSTNFAVCRHSTTSTTWYLDYADHDCSTTADQCEISTGTCGAYLRNGCVAETLTDGAYWDLHGTHVAGTIGQATNNAIGVAGMAFEAEILPLRVFDPTTDRSPATDQIAAILYAASVGVDVANLSVGGADCGGDTDGWGLARVRAAQYAMSVGMFFATSSGNDTLSCVPGWKRSVSQSGGLDGFTVVGNMQTSTLGVLTRRTDSNHGDGLDLMAPGTNILQSCAASVDFTTTQCTWDGTSMASPHVAAAAALLMAAGATNAEAEALLKSTAATTSGEITAGGFTYNSYSLSEHGSGFIQPAQALQELLGASVDCVDELTNCISPTSQDGCDADGNNCTCDDYDDDCDGDADDAGNAHDSSDGADEDHDGDGQTECEGDCDDADDGTYDSFKHAFRYTGSDDNWITGFGTTLETPLLGDVDGDHRADAVGYYADGDWYVALATRDDGESDDALADYFATEDRWIEGFGDGSTEQFLADVDGDGLADAVIFRGETGVWSVATSTGSSFAGMSTWVDDSGTDHGHGELSDHVMMGDVDGDGLADLVGFYQNNGESYSNDPDGDGIKDADGDGDADNEWWVAYSSGMDFGNGTDGSSGGYQLWVSGFGSDSDAEFVADVDGDGCADAVIMERDGDWKYVSGGCGSASTAKDLMVKSSGEASDLVLMGDVNGDGFADAGAFYVSSNDGDLDRVANYIGGTFESDGVSGDDHAAAGLSAVMKVGLNVDAEFSSKFISQYWIEDFGADANRIFLMNVDEPEGDPEYADLVAFYASTGTWKVARAVGWECSDEQD